MLRQVPQRLSQTRDERGISAAGSSGLLAASLLLLFQEGFLAFSMASQFTLIESIDTNLIPSDLRNNSRVEMQAWFWMIYQGTL